MTLYKMILALVFGCGFICADEVQQAASPDTNVTMESTKKDTKKEKLPQGEEEESSEENGNKAGMDNSDEEDSDEESTDEESEQ